MSGRRVVIVVARGHQRRLLRGQARESAGEVCPTSERAKKRGRIFVLPVLETNCGVKEEAKSACGTVTSCKCAFSARRFAPRRSLRSEGSSKICMRKGDIL